MVSIEKTQFKADHSLRKTKADTELALVVCRHRTDWHDKVMLLRAKEKP